jgi:lipopolysaccharide assembly protein A
MQFVRTLFWVLVLAALVIFTAFNWRPVEVQIWTNLVLETKIPALVIVAFLVGLVPTWLVHRGTKWRLQRRISHLEAAARPQAPARPSEPVDSAPLSPSPPAAPLP